MRIHEKLVIDMETGRVVEESGSEYEGRLARCDAFVTPLVAALVGTAESMAIPAEVAAGADIAMGGLGLGAAATPTMTAATSGLIGEAGQITAGGLLKAGLAAASLATGIAGKVSAANQAEAQGQVLEQQAKAAEQRQIQRDQTLLSRQHAVAAASGLNASSGSPLASTIDTTRDLAVNAASARRTGEMQAWSRRMEAQGYYDQIPGLVADDLLKLRPTVLSSFMSR